jgi:hypothetical protein
VAEMATRWRRSTARSMVTVAELLDRAAAVPRGSACTPAMSERRPAVSVDALLRREGRATQAQDRPAHPHGRRSATPDGGSPGRTRRTAVAASTLLAAGSVIGVALSSNTTEYAELGNTAQPVDAPPVGQSPPTPAGGQNLAPGEQTSVLGAAASTGALTAGSGPSADWTAVAFPPTTGSSADDPSAGSAETSDTTADAAAASGDEASAADPESRGDDDISGSDDDGNGGTPSSGSGSRAGSTPASSTPQDDDVVLADGGSADPAPATSEDLIPDGVAPGGAAPDGGESGGGAVSVDDQDDQDAPPAADDSTEEGPGAVDEAGSSTDTESGTDEATGDSDAESGSSSADEPDGAAEATDGGDGSAGEPAA